MNKLTKRLAAIGAAMTMAVSMMSVGASASGTVSCSTTNVGTNVNATYSFSVDGNYDLKNTFTAYCGQKGNKGIIVNAAGSYTITASCNSSTSVRLEIYKATTSGTLGTKTASVTIPKAAPALNNITTSVNLPAGKYYVKFVSNTYSTTWYSGYATIKNVYGVF